MTAHRSQQEGSSHQNVTTPALGFGGRAPGPSAPPTARVGCSNGRRRNVSEQHDRPSIIDLDQCFWMLRDGPALLVTGSRHSLHQELRSNFNWTAMPLVGVPAAKLSRLRGSTGPGIEAKRLSGNPCHDRKVNGTARSAARGRQPARVAFLRWN